MCETERGGIWEGKGERVIEKDQGEEGRENIVYL